MEWKNIVLLFISGILLVHIYMIFNHSYVKVPRGFEYESKYVNQYPAFYVSEYSLINNAPDKCLQIPNSGTRCINRKLRETSGDMYQSIKECNLDSLTRTNCLYNRDNYYPYFPQYVTIKKKPAINYKHSHLNAPQEYVKFLEYNMEPEFVNSTKNLSTIY